MIFRHFIDIIYLCIEKIKTYMRKLLVFTLIITLATTVSAQRKWTLSECIDYALQNNISLKKTQLARMNATEDVLQSQASLLPTLSASTNQSLGYRPWTNSGISTVTNGTVSSSVRKAYYNGSYGINAQWTVWNGNRNYNQLKLNRLYEEQAELDSSYTANSIQEQIAQLYIQILYLNEAISVNEQSLEASKLNEQRGQEMVDVGKMSKADLAQLTAQRATEEYNLVAAKTNLANSSDIFLLRRLPTWIQ
jgi:outer membrane protein